MTTEEAREAAIEVMAARIRSTQGRCRTVLIQYDPETPGLSATVDIELLAADVIDALVAATQDEICATCGGEGHDGATDPDGVPNPNFCPDCTNGRVPGAPLVLLGPRPLRDTEDDYVTINKAFDGDPHRWTGDPLPLYRSQRETQ